MRAFGRRDPEPLAHFDVPVAGPSPRVVRVQGWAVVPPGQPLWLAIDGEPVAPLALRHERPDVDRALGTAGGRGFNAMAALPRQGGPEHRLQIRDGWRVLAERALTFDAAAAPLEDLPPSSIGFQHLTACNLRCAMCPAHAEDNRFQGRSRLAPRALFERVAESVERLRPAMVTFNAWGEPLMNKDLFHYIETVKSIGPRISIALTTNGTLLEGERAERLLASGIDVVTVSLDAGRAETYERIRVGASWDAVLRNVTDFAALRERTGAATLLGTNFVLMRSNLAELPSYVARGAELGVDFANTVNAHSSYSVGGDSGVFDTPEMPEPARRERDRIYLQARETARGGGIGLRLAPTSPTPEPCDCSFKGSSGVVVATDGDVFPCCILYARHEEGDPTAQPMGNLHQDALEDIWYSERYVAFRRELLEGGDAHPICTGCPFRFDL